MIYQYMKLNKLGDAALRMTQHLWRVRRNLTYDLFEWGALCESSLR
jgi:hypothetical protein